MNKKRLSVVMAGAMLASSVAPVLAAEVVKSEYSANELGLLIKEIRETLNSKTFSNETDADKRINGTEAGKSVFFLKINGEVLKDSAITNDALQDKIGALKAGQKVEIWSKGYEEKDGKVYAKKSMVKTYTSTDLKNLHNNVFTTNNVQNTKYGNVIQNVVFDTNKDTLTLDFFNSLNEDGIEDIVLSIGSEEYDFNSYINKDGQIVSITGNIAFDDFRGFPKAKAEITDIPDELVREITITPGGYDLTVEELYDGLMLTTKGHDFFTAIKEARAMGRTVTIKGNNKSDDMIAYNGNDYKNVADAIKMINKKARFTVEFGAKGKLAAETYTITGTNEANAERLASWMIKPLAKVDILAGENRYETAVTIAKEYANLTSNTVTGKYPNGDINIVLVNGNALVDGLAASPLAASKANSVWTGSKYDQKAAPILLTEADALPKATKAYLKEILAEVKIGHLDDVTINLVGGESVLNRSLERELKGLGFKVERFGGDNREETSLEVAKEIDNAYDRAFVVGAEGEADAMSIAAVASELKTPIIVAKKGGISEEALYELKNQYVTVIGGETVVSKADYNAIKGEAKGVTRVFGDNRQKTNAEIIKKYYKKASATEGFVGPAENVIVAKDGQKNKSELIDALAAANMAAAKNAPIVLATNKLSNAQINALELNAVNTNALYQVGIGVNKDKVVRIIAENLGLTNR